MLNQRRLREGEWKRRDTLGSMIGGKTVGIVGLGRVGTNVARRLTGWGVEILAADPYVEPAQAYAVGASLVSLDELVREADFVTLHVVLTPETRHLIDEARLRAMKPSAYLINTSRGEAVDETALARALNEGWIAGAGLDVFEAEPLPPDSPLRRVAPDLLIMTPHSIGSSLASQQTGTRMAIENILRALRGEVPTFVKNPAVLERWRQRHAVGATA
jgi:D-3-phosphoglycerate dehydrogenase